MKLHDFDDFAERAMADAERRANVERHKQEAIAELVEYVLEVEEERGETS